MRKLAWIGGAFGAWLFFCASAAVADSVADFYHGKQITLVIGSDPGGGYDVAARILSHHLAQYIPGNPTIIAQNVPGAGGVTAMNNVADLAPKDGTVIGAPQSSSPLEPVFHLLSAGGSNAKFDATKLQWLGSAEQAVYLFAFWHDSPVHIFDDLKKQEVLVGASSPNTDEFIFTTLVNNIFSTKMKIISGYGSTPAVTLAIERGEIAGALNTYSSLMFRRPEWLSQNKVRVVLQLSLTPFAPLQGVPSALDLVKNDDDRRLLEVALAESKMARPYFMAPEVPPERVAAMRKALSATFEDPAYIDEEKKAGIIINPVSAETVQSTIENVYRTPESLLRRLRYMIGGKD
jgi:tripartite-type tricarboxylate transporter receptor subunit TctC